MIADSYFAIGRGHRVCQDYARASVGGEGDEGVVAAYACLSDGCSGSDDTDIGARLACLSAMHRWRQEEVAVVPARWLGEFLSERAVAMWSWMGTGHQALNATLLGVHWVPTATSPTITMLGDGAVAAARRDESDLTVLLHRYNPDAYGRVRPFYPIYAAGHWRGTSELILPNLSEGGFAWRLQMPIGDVDAVGRIASDYVQGASHAHGASEVVAVFSDGVESFKRKDADGRVIPVSALDVISQCMTFKGPLTSGFVARRCTSFLERFCPANGWFYTDDFSMAAVARTGDGG